MGSQPTKSPIRQKPLHQAGQSLDESLLDIALDKILLPMLAILLALLLAVMEWWRFFINARPNPWAMTFMAFLVAVICIPRVLRTWPLLKAMKLGSEGEKAMGQLLETFRADGYQVFHDIPGSGFNIDHVIVGPQGTYTIETKTRSKPPRGSVEVVFDGEKVTVNGWTPERDPVVQAQAESKWLHDMLQSTTSRSFWVQPVIAYPGWYVRETAQDTRVWVLNPDRLRKKILARQNQLKPEEIALIADRIALYVRSAPA